MVLTGVSPQKQNSYNTQIEHRRISRPTRRPTMYAYTKNASMIQGKIGTGQFNRRTKPEEYLARGRGDRILSENRWTCYLVDRLLGENHILTCAHREQGVG